MITDSDPTWVYRLARIMYTSVLQLNAQRSTVEVERLRLQQIDIQAEQAEKQRTHEAKQAEKQTEQAQFNVVLQLFKGGKFHGRNSQKSFATSSCVIVQRRENGIMLACNVSAASTARGRFLSTRTTPKFFATGSDAA